jgi:phosphoglycolate phosphatase
MTRAVLFDLDGTLVDTAGDLGHVLNLMRACRGLPALPDAAMRPQASHGTRGLLKVGFDVEPDHPVFEPLRHEFLDLYAQHLTRRSRPFPGMVEVLDTLETRGIAWGVVTNKPARFTEPLLAHLGLMARAACVVSGDTCAQPKPHPAGLLHACRVVGSKPADCLYVGDAERDAQAARAAGMPTLIALYGYIGAADRPHEWGGQGTIDRPEGLLDYLGLGV